MTSIVTYPGERSATPVLANDASFRVPTGKPGFRRALLLYPPVYDAQYWARWSQPAGLLRLATYLRGRGYLVSLMDCLETDAKGYVRKRQRVVNGKPVRVVRDNVTK